MSLNMIRYVICILVIGQVLVQSYRLLRGQPMHRCSTTACFSSNQIAEPLQELKKSLMREYSSFFNPMDRRFYSSDVEFVDPMTSFRGIDKYQNNVDMLAGRKGGIGKLLFRDASIILHNIRVMGSKELETRWTLQVSVRVPGSPRAKFTGVSRYSLDDNGLIAKQVDFWDSVNLVNGNYQTKPITEGLKDFFGQLQGETGAVQSAPELPYELLRRAKDYEVRRYPSHITAKTSYDKRPEGYDRLGSYTSTSNEQGKKIQYYGPTLMQIDESSGSREKQMNWPLQFALPGQSLPSIASISQPTIPKVDLEVVPEKVVAVRRFETAATEVVAKGYSGLLLQSIKNDGLKPLGAAGNGLYTVAQFDALFSLNKRRIEVWIELEDHPWKP